MAYTPKFSRTTSDYTKSASALMGEAQQAMGKQRPIQEDPGPTAGGAMGAGLGAGLAMAGVQAAAAEGSMFAVGGALGGPLGIGLAAGVGILSHILS